MPIIDYTQDPATGAYTFHRDDGTSMPFADSPEAQSLAGWVDQTRQGPDMRLAQNGAPPAGGGAGDWIRNQVATEQQPGPPETRSDAVPMMAQRPPQEAPQMDPSAGLREAINAPVYTPGRAAIDPAKMREQGQYVPTARQRTGGLDMTPEEKSVFEESAKTGLSEQRASMEKQRALYDTQAEESANQSIDARLEMQRLEQEKAQLDAQRAQKDRWIDSQMQAAQRDQDLIAQQKVDPRRLFHGEGGMVNGIMSAVAVGLGAFGAALTGGPNTAAQIIQTRIQQDIDAQTNDIERRGARANNLIARMMQMKGMSLDEARAAATAYQANYARQEAIRQAGVQGTMQAQQAQQQLDQTMATFQLDQWAKYKEMLDGRASTAEAFVQPQRASAGGYRAPTEAERQQRLETMSKYQRVTGTEPAKPGESGVVKIGGETFRAPKDVAAKAQERVSAIDQAEKNLIEKKKLLNENTLPTVGSSGDRLKVLDAETAAAMAQIHGIRSTDPKAMELAAGGADWIGNGDKRAGIDQALKSLQEQKLQLQDQLRRGAGVPDSEAAKEESDFQATGEE